MTILSLSCKRGVGLWHIRNRRYGCRMPAYSSSRTHRRNGTERPNRKSPTMSITPEVPPNPSHNDTNDKRPPPQTWSGPAIQIPPKPKPWPHILISIPGLFLLYLAFKSFGSEAGAGPWILATLLYYLYFLPTVMAYRDGREKVNATTIFFVNLIVGWTLIGWIACLLWSISSSMADLHARAAWKSEDYN